MPLTTEEKEILFLARLSTKELLARILLATTGGGGGGGDASAANQLLEIDLLNELNSSVNTSPIPAGEAHIGQVGGTTGIVPIVFSLDTNAYAAGDVLAATQVLSSAFRISNGTGILQSIFLLDKDDVGAEMTLYFLDANVSIGTENAAPSITDANADNLLGFVNVAAADWKDLGGCKVANISGIGLPVKSITGDNDLYVAIVNGSGTPTFTAAGLTARFGILQD